MSKIKKFLNFYYELKKFDKLATATERMSAIIEYINVFGYIIGVEVKDDWRMNNRATFTLFLILITLWLIGYTLYAQFPSLSCVELLGGLALTLMVNGHYVIRSSF